LKASGLTIQDLRHPRGDPLGTTLRQELRAPGRGRLPSTPRRSILRFPTKLTTGLKPNNLGCTRMGHEHDPRSRRPRSRRHVLLAVPRVDYAHQTSRLLRRATKLASRPTTSPSPLGPRPDAARAVQAATRQTLMAGLTRARALVETQAASHGHVPVLSYSPGRSLRFERVQGAEGRLRLEGVQDRRVHPTLEPTHEHRSLEMCSVNALVW